jgi:hypothetical protein
MFLNVITMLDVHKMLFNMELINIYVWRGFCFWILILLSHLILPIIFGFFSLNKLKYWTRRGIKLWRMWRLNECQCLNLSNESWQNIGLCLWWCKFIPTKSKLQKLSLQIHFELYFLCLNFALAEVHWGKLRPIIWNSFGETKAIL